MSDFEIALRSVAVVILLLLAGGMLAVPRRDHARWLGAAFAASVASFVLTSGAGASGWLGGFGYPLTALCVAKAVLFWLFAKAQFADEFRLKPPHIALLALAVAWGGWQQLVFDGRARLGSATLPETLASGAFELFAFVCVILALVEAYHGLVGDLVERRRRLRILFVAGVSAYLAAAVFLQAYNLALQTATPAALVLLNLALIAACALAAAANLVQTRAGSWLDPDAGGAAIGQLDPADRRVLEALTEAFERQPLWREAGLTIGALAVRLRVREQSLRRAINRGLGFRNFNDFLHSCRIREACQRLRRAEDARLPVLSIALGVGYGSIGPFNRAFRARIGMTPTRFRREAAAAGRSLP